MSRTDAHGPFWSWLNDPAARKEVHDHRNGPCDLPSVQDQLRKDGRALRRTRCRWEVDHTRVPPLCGCRMCTEHEWRVAQFVARVFGPEATLWNDLTRGLTYAPGYTIMGGTSNVMRNIIGERVLGLPREPR